MKHRPKVHLFSSFSDTNGSVVLTTLADLVMVVVPVMSCYSASILQIKTCMTDEDSLMSRKGVTPESTLMFPTCQNVH